jgi:hypothetical protein
VSLEPDADRIRPRELVADGLRIALQEHQWDGDADVAAAIGPRRVQDCQSAYQR